MKILHVPYTYFPDPSGGTEIYVHALASRLSSFGYTSEIAAPALKSARYDYDGMQVHRFGVDARARLELAYGEPDEVAAASFAAILGAVRPDIVHLHARSAAVSERLFDLASALGARTVFTYHTPTVSCIRGTMMHLGTTPCDGRIDDRRCAVCALQSRGMPLGFAQLAVGTPFAIRAAATAIGGRTARAAAIPALIAGAGERFSSFVHRADRVVAVCEWVRRVLLVNGVDSARITLCRQGVSSVPTQSSKRECHPSLPLRLAYFGRIDRSKAPSVVARALRCIPTCPVRLDIYGIVQNSSEPEYERLQVLSTTDDRVRLLPPLAFTEVAERMARYDLIAVPSKMLETGPLVVLEAFAAGVPVLGSARGGISELVRHDFDGFLVGRHDAQAWAEAIDKLAQSPEIVQRLRRNVRPPRTMEDVAEDMARLYASLVGERTVTLPTQMR